MRHLFLTPVFALALVLVGCEGCAVKQPGATTTVALRPGALNQFDQTTYDALIVVQASLNAAKPIVAASYPTLKPTLNQAIAAYNTAEAAYRVYHTTAGKDPAQQTALAQQVADLTHQVAGLSASLGAQVQ